MKGSWYVYSFGVAFILGIIFAQYGVKSAKAQTELELPFPSADRPSGFGKKGNSLQENKPGSRRIEYLCLKNRYEGWVTDPVLTNEMNKYAKRGWVFSSHQGSEQEYICFKRVVR